jgi:hypothetical protein
MLEWNGKPSSVTTWNGKPPSVTMFSTDFSFQTWFFGIYLNFQRQQSLKN